MTAWVRDGDEQDVTFRGSLPLRRPEGRARPWGGRVGRSVLHACILRDRVNAPPSPPGQHRLQSPLHSQSLRNCSFLNSPGKVQYAMRTCAHSCAFQMWSPGTPGGVACCPPTQEGLLFCFVRVSRDPLRQMYELLCLNLAYDGGVINAFQTKI